MNDIPQLKTYDMGDGIVAFSTTRHGGVSTGTSYASFNINPFCGDAPAHVAANRELLCKELGIDSRHLILPHQTHGVDTRIISDEFCALPDNVRQMVLEGVDAVMTNVPGVCVGVSTADCIPVLLHDPKHRAVCAVHAGWRGTLARITHKATVDMRAAYGTNPADLVAVIGPGISLDAFEVGDEVYEQFAAADFNLDRAADRASREVAPRPRPSQPRAARAERSRRGQHKAQRHLHLQPLRPVLLRTPPRHRVGPHLQRHHDRGVTPQPFCYNLN